MEAFDSRSYRMRSHLQRVCSGCYHIQPGDVRARTLCGGLGHTLAPDVPPGVRRYPTAAFSFSFSLYLCCFPSHIDIDLTHFATMISSRGLPRKRFRTRWRA